MRNLIWLFLLLISITTVISCDEDEPGTNNEGIAGTWQITAVDYSGTSTTTVPGSPPSTATFTGMGYDMNLTITFVEDPNTYTTSGDYSIELVTMLSGQSFTTQLTNEGFLGNGTWERNGNTLTATDSDGSVGVATIISETSNEIIFEVSSQETQVEQGATIVYDIDGTYTFTR